MRKRAITVHVDAGVWQSLKDIATLERATMIEIVSRALRAEVRNLKRRLPR